MLADTSGPKRRHIWKLKLRNLKLTIRSNMLGTCIGASVTLRRVTSQKVTIVKDEKGDLVADSHSFLARWRNHFSQLLNVRGVNDDRQTETQTEESLVIELSAFEVEMATEKLKKKTKITGF
jgi:hypothetical protein